MIVEAIVIGGSFLSGIVIKHLICATKKQSKLPKGVYPFMSLKDYNCPKCDRRWVNDDAKYCECAEHYNEHYHLTCCSNDKKCGCNYKWICETKV